MTHYELRIIADCPNSGPALELYRSVLAKQCRDAEVHVREITSDDEARKLGFHGSPSFLAAGLDLFPSDAAAALSCRVYPSAQGMAGLPSAETLGTALRGVCSEA